MSIFVINPVYISTTQSSTSSYTQPPQQALTSPSTTPKINTHRTNVVSLPSHEKKATRSSTAALLHCTFTVLASDGHVSAHHQLRAPRLTIFPF